MLNAINNMINTASDALKFNQSTLSGCLDIIVIKHKDGTLKSTGFHARFGKLYALSCQNKLVQIKINGRIVDVTMRLGKSGEAYFEEEVFGDDDKENSTKGQNRALSRQDTGNSGSTKATNMSNSDVRSQTSTGSQEDNSIGQSKKTLLDSFLDMFRKTSQDSDHLKVEKLIDPKPRGERKSENVIQLLKEDDLRIKNKNDMQIQGCNVPTPLPSCTGYKKVDDNELKISEQAFPNVVKSGRNNADQSSQNIETPNTADGISPNMKNLNYFENLHLVKNMEEDEMLKSTTSSNSSQSTRSGRKIRKSLRLSSKKLQSLGLKAGKNDISFIIDSKLQGTHEVSAHIYLWSDNVKIIATDVDGTVTKSDVLGAMLPLIGKDWTQPGIAPLFANIKRNGYHILYITSRAIGQIGFTRDFVASVYQDGCKLPEGPIISSPDQLLACFKREIIFSRPEYFKAACLRDIANCFPKGVNPFHAAFGNRESDAVAYRFVGIPLERIFTVNQYGEVHHYEDFLTKSYAFMNTKVKEIFPCIEATIGV